MRKFIMLCLLFCSMTTGATDFVPPFTAKYTLYTAGLPIGEGTRRLFVKNDHWVFESQSHTTGILAAVRDDQIAELTEFTVNATQVRPLNYEFHQTGSKKQKHVRITFDWKARIAKNIADAPWEVALVDDTLDSLLYQVVIMRDLQQGKRDLSYQIADRAKIKTYAAEFQGEDVITTGVGKLTTLRYRYDSTDGKRHTTLWCAPKLHYLVVQVEHDEKGLVIKTVLDSVTGL
jgi:Protein of unknown function (DUF3108)